MKKIRKNILKSLLFICLGLTVTTIVFARVQRPDAPGRPEFFDIRANGCMLRYLAPKNDGGSKIVLYLIERKEDTWGWDSWKSCGSSPTLQFFVGNMEKGASASFRVFAVNEAGVGDASLPSNIVKFEDPF